MGELSFIRFFAISAFAAAGIFIGIVQSWISPEEMRAGRKYFAMMRYAAAALLVGIAAYSGSMLPAALGVAALGLIYWKKDYLSYAALGAYLGLLPAGFVPAAALVIFIDGMAFGSMLYRSKRKYPRTAISILLFFCAMLLAYYAYHLSSLI